MYDRLLKSERVRKCRTIFSIHTFLKSTLKKHLSTNNVFKLGEQFKGKRVLVPLIETSHYQHFQVLIVAKALQMRGAHVKVLLCGEVLRGCEIKSVRNEKSLDPCWSCRLNARHLTPLFGLDLTYLSDYVPSHELNYGVENVSYCSNGERNEKSTNDYLGNSIHDSIVRYYYGAVPHDQETVDCVKDAHASTAQLSVEIAKRIDAEWNPDVVFNNMYCYSAWEPFYNYYSSHGNRFKSLSMTQFDFNCVKLNEFELYGSDRRFVTYLKSRKDKYLNHSEAGTLKLFCEERFKGNSQIFQSDNYFKEQSQESIIERLFLDRSKRNIFLFSNIYWDVGLSEMGGLYEDVISWVIDSIDLVKNMTNCHLYIKPHPGEVLDSSSSLKGMSEIIHDKYANLPDNVSIIEPEWKITTYSLFPLVDLGVIFSGTLGLEMMLNGVPVVSTGKTTHMGLDFAAEPSTIDEYVELLKGNTELGLPDQKELELFAYFYFIRTLIPWNLTKRAYGDNFDGFTFDSLSDIMPGQNPLLDHLCNCILNADKTVIEAWPSSS